MLCHEGSVLETRFSVNLPAKCSWINGLSAWGQQTNISILLSSSESVKGLNIKCIYFLVNQAYVVLSLKKSFKRDHKTGFTWCYIYFGVVKPVSENKDNWLGLKLEHYGLKDDSTGLAWCVGLLDCHMGSYNQENIDICFQDFVIYPTLCHANTQGSYTF